MVLVAHLGTHCAHAHAIDHFASVAVVPGKRSQAVSPEVPNTNGLEAPPERKNSSYQCWFMNSF